MAKKGQFLILSGLFILLLSIFIYSLETDNTYILNLKDSSIVENIQFETCKVLKMSNGTQIISREAILIQNIENYCFQRDVVCNLTLINNTIVPPFGNFSLLNYTHYNLSLEISQGSKNYNSQFKC